MKIRTLALLIIVIGLNSMAFGQDNLDSKGARMIMGTGSFSSVGNNYSSERANSLALSYSYDKFYKDKMYLGVGIKGLYQSDSNFSSTAISVGPKLGCMFGNVNNKMYSFLEGGCSLQIGSTESTVENCGIDLSLGLGIILPIQKNVGFVIEGKYDRLKLLSSETKWNGISIDFGIVGLLF